MEKRFIRVLVMWIQTQTHFSTVLDCGCLWVWEVPVPSSQLYPSTLPPTGCDQRTLTSMSHRHWPFSCGFWISGTLAFLGLQQSVLLGGSPSIHTVQESTWGHTVAVNRVSFLYCWTIEFLVLSNSILFWKQPVEPFQRTSGSLEVKFLTCRRSQALLCC